MSKTKWIALASLALITAGCGGMKADKKSAIERPESGLTFSLAGKNLPTNRLWKSQFAFGDADGDGRPEIGTVSRLADGPWIFRRDDEGSWSAFAEGLPREQFCGGGMHFADVNKDGHVDVAIGDHCKGVYVFLGDSKGNWIDSSSGLPSIGTEDVALGDFDNDGCADLVSIAAEEEGVRAFRNAACAEGKAVWEETSAGLATTDWGNGVVFGDVDNDGNLDIGAAYAHGPRVWLGNGKGEWEESSAGLPAPEILGLYWGIDLGDLNGDGRMDLAAGSQMPPTVGNCGATPDNICTGGGLEIFFRNEDGTWSAKNSGVQAMNSLGVAIGDINGDGKGDVVAVGKKALREIGGVYGVFPYLGDGEGNWTLAKGTGLPDTGRMRTWGVGIADVNGDGAADLGIAFGDVVSPSWRSGAKDKKKEKKKDKKKSAPTRGRFGQVEVWLGKTQ